MSPSQNVSERKCIRDRVFVTRICCLCFCLELSQSQNVSETEFLLSLFLSRNCLRARPSLGAVSLWPVTVSIGNGSKLLKNVKTFPKKEPPPSNCHKWCKVWIPLKGRRKVKQIHFFVKRKSFVKSILLKYNYAGFILDLIFRFLEVK